jgi:transcriptional regulator
MYVPAKFSVDEDAAWTIVEEAGAGTLVVQTPAGLASVVVPVVVSEDRRTMWSHLAKANPWWKSLEEGAEVLALFQTASAYVTPSYYPSRLERPGVVPTWNYVAAEVRGRLTLHADQAWLMNQVRALTEQFERDRDPEWRVDDSDESYLEGQLKAIVGIEIAVEAIIGKAKLSQNRPPIDHDSVRDHFAAGTPREQNVAKRM